MTLKHSKRAIFAGLSSFQVLAMFRRGLFYTYLSIYMRSYLGLSTTLTSLYATVPMVFSSIFQMFVWGRVSDRTQKRRTLIITGEIIAGILLTIVYLLHRATSDLQLAGIILICGLGFIEIFWSMSNIGWSALVSDLYAPKKRSKIIGELTALGGFGRIIGISIGGILYDLNQTMYEGWGFHNGALFYIASGVMLISTLPMLLAPEGGKKYRQETEEGFDEIEVPKRIQKSNISVLKIFTIFIIGLAIVNIGRNSISTIYSQFLTLDSGYNFSPKLLGYIANTQSISVIITGILAGRFSKRFGESKTLIIAIIINILAILSTAFIHSTIIIFISSFFLGSSMILISVTSYTLASMLIPAERRAKLFGLYNATFFLSWGIGSTMLVCPVIDSLIASSYSEVFSYQIGFLIASVISVIGMFILLFLEWRIRTTQNINEEKPKKIEENIASL
ncbi:MAG: MFS transporter [Promethearchaeota archaeon]